MNNDVIAAILAAGALAQRTGFNPVAIVSQYREILAELEKPAEVEVAKPEPKHSFGKKKSGYSAPKTSKSLNLSTI